MSYQDLFDRLTEACGVEHAAYMSYLSARYARPGA